MNDNCYLTWIIAGLGFVALLGVFITIIIRAKKEHGKGMGPYNLRAIGIVIVLTFTALIATTPNSQNSTLTATIGIFGAIAGYLFGEKEPKTSRESLEKRVSELEARIPKT